MKNHTSLNQLVLLSIILPGVCYSNTLPQIPHGFYIGPSTSVTSTTLNNQMEFNPSEVENAGLYARNQYGSTTQVQPGFILGYEHVINQHWLLGAEFQANFLKSYQNSSGTDYINNVVTANNQFALQVRAGTSLTDNDNFIYALIGIARTKTNVKINFDNTNLTVGALGILQLGPINSSHNMSGVKFGVGYEKHFSPHLGVRVDYSHTQYGSVKNALADPMFDGIFLYPLGTSTISQSSDMLSFTLVFLT
jgi:opacity protein-like surface antigen